MEPGSSCVSVACTDWITSSAWALVRFEDKKYYHFSQRRTQCSGVRLQSRAASCLTAVFCGGIRTWTGWPMVATDIAPKPRCDDYGGKVKPKAVLKWMRSDEMIIDAAYGCATHLTGAASCDTKH
jgi:hypothetical protein